MEASMVSKKRKVWVILVPTIILLILVLAAVVVMTVLANNASGKVLTQTLSESLGDATATRFDFNVGTGNLTIDRLAGGEPLLASGELQYLEGQDRPAATVDMNGHLYTLTLKASGGRQPGFQLPWSANNGETDWHIYLNPTLPSDITVYSDGGNLKLNLAGMIVTRLEAETSGGNVDVDLPASAPDMSVTAKTGGGNVVVRLPAGLAAHILASTGMGKLTIDPQFTKIDDHTYQSPDYPNEVDKIEITAESGAGDVSVITK
jgi:hypothetical protein